MAERELAAAVGASPLMLARARLGERLLARSRAKIREYLA